MNADNNSYKIHPLPLVSEGKKQLPGKIQYFMEYGWQTFLTKKRKISYNGVLFMEESSDFLNNRLNQGELKEASKTLHSGLEELEKYEMRDPSMAARSSFDGAGYSGAFFGVGPFSFDGNIDEQKPSAYQAFRVRGKDKKDYENFLDDTISESYNHIKYGFKSKENDKKFNVLTNAAASSENIDPSQIIAINDYLRGIENVANSATHAYDDFKRCALEDMHAPEFRNASRRRKAELLSAGNIHLISRPTEYLSRKSYVGPVLFSSSLVGAIFLPIISYNVFENPAVSVATIIPLASTAVYTLVARHPGIYDDNMLLAEIRAEKNGEW